LQYSSFRVNGGDLWRPGRLGPASVMGALDVPLGHLGFDDAGLDRLRRTG